MPPLLYAAAGDEYGCGTPHVACAAPEEIARASREIVAAVREPAVPSPWPAAIGARPAAVMLRQFHRLWMVLRAMNMIPDRPRPSRSSRDRLMGSQVYPRQRVGVLITRRSSNAGRWGQRVPGGEQYIRISIFSLIKIIVLCAGGWTLESCKGLNTFASP